MGFATCQVKGDELPRLLDRRFERRNISRAFLDAAGEAGDLACSDSQSRPDEAMGHQAPPLAGCGLELSHVERGPIGEKRQDLTFQCGIASGLAGEPGKIDGLSTGFCHGGGLRLVGGQYRGHAGRNS